ncbi:MAG: glycosyltransferase family 1 protein [Hyphomicrobiales bacterium]|nr:glycosyltransferase family 1 protein [Hyphomicrobiales bacterium]
MMRILVVTDAWRPQVNGVVHSLLALQKAAAPLGGDIRFLTHRGFATFGLPTYGEIRLALAPPWRIARRIERAQADHIHIATEGTLGLAARRICLARGIGFTTSYHTRYPEYVHARTRLPHAVSYAALRAFHNAGGGVMAPTQSMVEDLRARGFRNVMLWSRGVDCALFYPRAATLDLPRPIFLYAGRVAVEKNIEAFLSLDLPGSKLVAGDGPARAQLQARFPQAHFVGMKTQAELAELYAAADVFVFPSLTDTFGVVLLEAMASGLPVAAFPAVGPRDVVAAGAGVLSQDLRAACLAALRVPRAAARAHAQAFTWENSAQQFLDNVRCARAQQNSASFSRSGKASSRAKASEGAA